MVNRYCQGDTLRLLLLFTEGGVATNPDAAPEFSIHSPSGQTGSGRLAYTGLTGQFTVDLFVGDNPMLPAVWATGRHYLIVSYDVSTAERKQLFAFDVVAGGDPQGGVVAIEFVDRPHVDTILTTHESGCIIKRTNPRTEQA